MLPLWISVGLVGIRGLPYGAPIRAEAIAQQDQALSFRDRNGLPLGTLLSQDQDHTQVVPLEKISPHLTAALIAAEDQRFYQHHGVDLWALGRAVGQAVQRRQIVSGASTISMQLARMLDPKPRTLWSKTQEIWQAWRLEAGMSKAEILAAYLNRLPLGGNLYGIEAGARYYFNTPAADLTLAQATLLAALPNDPVHLNPYANRPGLRQRQRYILQRLVAEGNISPAQSHQAAAEDLFVRLPEDDPLIAPHYLFWLAEQRQGNFPQAPITGPIATTLDRPLQEFVSAQVRQLVASLAPHNVNQAAALVLDNHNGEVLAYVGSPRYWGDRQGRNDGVQALRQPGSTLKPFLYQLALDTGKLQPNSILNDSPVYYAIPGAQLYSPVDYSNRFLGPIRLRLALGNSLNIPAVKTLEQVTVPVFLEQLQSLGFRHLTHPPDHYGLGLALGSGEVSLWELAHAYQTLAQSTLAPSSPLNPQTARYITHILSDPHARAREFGIDSALALPFPAAVKTGTSSGYRDTWTVGYTTDYTVATWVGNFDGSAMQNVSGVTGAAPLWHRIMLHLHERQEPKPFPKPAWPQEKVCATTGLPPQADCQTVVLEFMDPQYPQQNSLEKATIAPPLAIKTQTQNQTQAQNPFEKSVQITFPRMGDRFLLDRANLDSAHLDPKNPQKLRFELLNRSDRPVTWFLNGQPLQKASTAETATMILWTPQVGDWVLEARGEGGSDRVTFRVEPVARNGQRRGFVSTTQPNAAHPNGTNPPGVRPAKSSSP